MKAYRNEVWDMFGNYFIEHKIRVIPRYENIVSNSLVVVSGKFKTSTVGQRKYRVDIVNRPSIPDNSKYWKEFEDNMQIKIFLDLSSEFVNNQIDSANDNFENFQDAEESEEEIVENIKLKNSLGGKGYSSVEE